MGLRLKGRVTTIFGLKNSGKSNFLQWLLTRPPYYGSHLMYDLCREHGPLRTYQPKYRRGEESEEELNRVVERMVTARPRKKRPEVLAIEEISRWCSSQSKPPESVYELIDLARHYGVGLVTVSRRPAQVHSDLTELADNMIFFRLTGRNDYRTLNEMVDGLGDVVRSLDDYQYARVTGDRKVYVHDPVPEMDTTGRL